MKYRLIVKNTSIEKISSRLIFSEIKDLIEDVSLFRQDNGSVCVEFSIEFNENSNEKKFFEEILRQSNALECWSRLTKNK